MYNRSTMGSTIKGFSSSSAQWELEVQLQMLPWIQMDALVSLNPPETLL